MTTTERVNLLKEVLATSFMLATEKSTASGISFVGWNWMFSVDE